MASCHDCSLLVGVPADGHGAGCPRCGAHLHSRKIISVRRGWSLVFAASVLYIPANVLPIMTTDQLGRSTDSTILGGVVLLCELGSYPVAAVIFIASVLVPLGKLLGLVVLCWSVAGG